MDFSAAFHLILVAYFMDVFYVMVVIAYHEEYLVKEPKLYN